MIDMHAPTTPETVSDWTQFEPSAYLEEYYADIGAENLALLHFLDEAYRSIPEAGVLLDFGGGPTIYPLISAAPRVEEIHFCDYLQPNVEEVRRWLAEEPNAFDWAPFIRKVLEIENNEGCTHADVAERSRIIRASVTRLMRCDASRRPPVEGPPQLYDVLLTNFCADSATADPSQWRKYMANIVSVLRPGGRLILSALKGATRYSVGKYFFPAVRISEKDLVRVLAETGFPRREIEVTTVQADRPCRDYQGLMFATAQKRV